MNAKARESEGEKRKSSRVAYLLNFVGTEAKRSRNRGRVAEYAVSEQKGRVGEIQESGTSAKM